jgi:hypothetical protein
MSKEHFGDYYGDIFNDIFGSLGKESNEFWDKALSGSKASAHCEKCDTIASYSGSATEVNAALREFKEIHGDCNSGQVDNSGKFDADGLKNWVKEQVKKS